MDPFFVIGVNIPQLLHLLTKGGHIALHTSEALMKDGQLATVIFTKSYGQILAALLRDHSGGYDCVALLEVPT
jgi:hypothetical protein